MAINRVDYAGETLLDVSESTVTEDNLLAGARAINAAGEMINGGVVVTNTWEGTLAEFEAQKDSIPNDTYISIKDDKLVYGVFDDATTSNKKGWTSRRIEAELYYKLGGLILEATSIPSSQTSITFTDANITEDSIIDVYDSIFGFNVKNITVSSGSCTVEFDAQSSTHDMKIVILRGDW